ncbi:MAG: DUF3047 domain-containing protein [Geminicoccaceae bacterium]
MALCNLGRAWLGLLVVLVVMPALAAVDEILLADGWSEVTFDDKIPNRFLPGEAGDVVVQSDGSVSLVQRALDVDLEATPILSWRWRVTTQAPPTDLAVRGEDDRSLALYVAFPFVPEEAGVMERMRRAIVERAAGKEAPGRVLMYVWGGEGDRGDRVESPYLGSSGIITILRPAGAEPGVWLDEMVNIAEDYRRTFGSEPPDPISIAIGADTDDTGSQAEGFVAGLTFVERPRTSY